MLISFFLSLFIACSNPYKEAESQNTIEAYEKFIAENPNNGNVKLAQLKIENLLLEKARKSNKIEDYEAFLKKYASKKDSENYKDAFSEKMFLSWEKTQQDDTEAAYHAFIEEYGHTQDKVLITARLMKKIAPYKKDIVFGKIEKEEIDTTQSSTRTCTAKGTTLNGWMFKTTVTNNTTRDIKGLRVKLLYLDDDGKVVGQSQSTDEGNVMIGLMRGREDATPDRRRPPFKVGETRDWCYITGDTPTDWSKQIRLQPIELVFMND